MFSKIIYKVTWAHMLRHKKRTGLMLTGLILTVMLLTAVFVGKDSLLHHLKKASETQFGKWHVTAYDLNENQYQEVINSVPADRVGLSQNGYYSHLPQHDQMDKHLLNLRYYSSQAFDWNNIVLESGRLPQSAQEIVLSQDILKQWEDLKLGAQIEVETFRRMAHNHSQSKFVFPFIQFELAQNSRVELPYNFPYMGDDLDFQSQVDLYEEKTGFREKLTVVGFIASPSFEEGTDFYTGLTYLDPQTLDFKRGPINLSLRYQNAGEAAQYNSILSQLDLGELVFNNKVLGFDGQSSDSVMNAIFLFAQLFFSLLIILVSVVLIYNLFHLSYDDRLYYLAQLTSVGATSHQRKASVYFEVGFLLILALPLGFLGGLGLVYFGIKAIESQILAIYQLAPGQILGLTIKPQALLIILGLTFLTAILSAYLPAQKMGKLSLIEGLKTNHVINKPATLQLKLSLEASLAQRFLRFQCKQVNSIIRSLSVFLLVLYVTTYGSQVMVAVVKNRLVDQVAVSLPFVEDAKHRLVALPEGAERLLEMEKDLLSKSEVSNLKTIESAYSIGQLPQNKLSQAYHEALYQVLQQYYGEDWSYEDYEQKFKNQPDRSPFVDLLALDDGVFKEMLLASGLSQESWDSGVLVYQSGKISTQNVSVFGQAAAEFKHFDLERMVDVEAGDKLPIIFSVGYDEKAQRPIQEVLEIAVLGNAERQKVGKWVENKGEKIILLMSRSYLDHLRTIGLDSLNQSLEVSLSFEIDQSRPAGQNLVKQLQGLGENGSVHYMGGATSANGYFDLIESILTFVMTTFSLLASVISLLNIYNSLMLYLNKRRQEFAVLQSLGMTKKQLSNLLSKEILHIYLRSLLLALPLIGLATWAIYQGIVMRFGSLSLPIPYFLLIFVLGLGASVWYFVQIYLRRLDEIHLIDQIRQNFR